MGQPILFKMCLTVPLVIISVTQFTYTLSSPVPATESGNSTVTAPAVAVTSRYSPSEAKLIRQFRVTMGKKLYKDYMKSDDYLITWLKASFMDIGSAKEMLENNLRWRKENKIDAILEEDFKQLAQTFKLNFVGEDKQGRPLLVSYFGAWDVRKAVISGQSDKLQRYLCQQLELASKAIREANATNPYHNVTDLVIIFDGNGYNLRQHGCLACIPEYVHFINNLETYYPLLTNKIIVVNAPTVFQQLYRIILPLFHPETAKGISVYDVDKTRWRNELLKYISMEELPKRLGGLGE